LTMFSALAAVCTVYCAIEIVLITLHLSTGNSCLIPTSGTKSYVALPTVAQFHLICRDVLYCAYTSGWFSVMSKQN